MPGPWWRSSTQAIATTCVASWWRPESVLPCSRYLGGGDELETCRDALRDSEGQRFFFHPMFEQASHPVGIHRTARLALGRGRPRRHLFPERVVELLAFILQGRRRLVGRLQLGLLWNQRRRPSPLVMAPNTFQDQVHPILGRTERGGGGFDVVASREGERSGEWLNEKLIDGVHSIKVPQTRGSQTALLERQRRPHGALGGQQAQDAGGGDLSQHLGAGRRTEELHG